MTVDDAFVYTPRVQQVALASNHFESFVGRIARSSGWGVTELGGASNVLRYVDNVVITNAACAAVYGNFVNEHVLCVDTTGGQSTCTGDSGG